MYLVRMTQGKYRFGIFFEGCADFLAFDLAAQEHARSMVYSTIDALRSTCVLRSLSTIGNRKDLIIRIVRQHQSNRQVIRSGKAFRVGGFGSK